MGCVQRRLGEEKTLKGGEKDYLLGQKKLKRSREWREEGGRTKNPQKGR